MLLRFSYSYNNLNNNLNNSSSKKNIGGKVDNYNNLIEGLTKSQLENLLIEIDKGLKASQNKIEELEKNKPDFLPKPKKIPNGRWYDFYTREAKPLEFHTEYPNGLTKEKYFEEKENIKEKIKGIGIEVKKQKDEIDRCENQKEIINNRLSLLEKIQSLSVNSKDFLEKKKRKSRYSSEQISIFKHIIKIYIKEHLAVNRIVKRIFDEDPNFNIYDSVDSLKSAFSNFIKNHKNDIEFKSIIEPYLKAKEKRENKKICK